MKTPFDIHRGINISHWLSQSGNRGEKRKNFFRFEDADFIRQCGFDHLRLPVDEEQLWTENGEKDSEAFGLLHQAVQWCQTLNMKCIVDLHILKCHHFNAEFNGDENSLFSDPDAAAHFSGLWKDLSQELKDTPLSTVAYEILNEPVAEHSEDWNRVLQAPLAGIRNEEPERWVIIGANEWQNPKRVNQIRVPEDDRCLMLSFHYYAPLMLTHYRAGWFHSGHYTGAVRYPGVVVEEQDFLSANEEQAEKIRESGGGVYFDRSVLEAQLKEAVEFAAQSDRPLYCGEFGCHNMAPRQDLLRWTEDLTAVLDKHRIPWAKWDYKGVFRIKDPLTGEADQGLLDCMFHR